ncbi:MAG: hypothetical protein FWG70_09470 [Oscillospiraceae bacterium]|nr:hypothetical protein [Oscillospiraceae bacterium]
MKKKLLLYFIILCLFSACEVEKNLASDILDAPVDGTINEAVDSTAQNPITTPSPITTASPETSLPPPETSEITETDYIRINDNNIDFLNNIGDPGEQYISIAGRLYDLYFSNEFFTASFYNIDIIPGFQELVEEETFVAWKASYYNAANNREPALRLVENFGYVVDENFPFTGECLDDSANIHTFICDFNITEEQIRSIIANEDSYEHDADPLFNIFSITFGDYTEEQINALCSRDIGNITLSFTRDYTVIKNDKCYSLSWFFYAPANAYKENNMTKEDLINVLREYEIFSEYGSPLRLIHPFTIDFLQQKIYNALDGDIDVFELCGYDRDFSMPLAYESLFTGISEQRYYAFHANEIETSNVNNELIKYIITALCIEKDDSFFSPHWVYYNKPAAYLEAGITPEELIEMLPKYEALGILTDEAWEALQGKIYAYADEG